MKTDTVHARILGESVLLRLERDDQRIASLERMTQAPLFLHLQRIAEGSWSSTAFAAILSAAHVGAPARLLGMPSALIGRALLAHPPGLYAPLVAKVIEAFLFGLDDAEAVFDDAAASVAA